MRTTARSVSGSAPTRRASNWRPSARVAVSCSLSATTWLLVRTKPSGVKMKPEAAPSAVSRFTNRRRDRVHRLDHGLGVGVQPGGGGGGLGDARRPARTQPVAGPEGIQKRFLGSRVPSRAQARIRRRQTRCNGQRRWPQGRRTPTLRSDDCSRHPGPCGSSGTWRTRPWETFLTLLNLRHSARHPQPPPELNGVLDQAHRDPLARLPDRAQPSQPAQPRAARRGRPGGGGQRRPRDAGPVAAALAAGDAASPSPLVAGTLYVLLLVWASSFAHPGAAPVRPVRDRSALRLQQHDLAHVSAGPGERRIAEPGPGGSPAAGAVLVHGPEWRRLVDLRLLLHRRLPAPGHLPLPSRSSRRCSTSSSRSRKAPCNDG